MVQKKYGFGIITEIERDDFPEVIMSFSGMLREIGNFVSKYDETIWQSFWKGGASVFGLKYVHENTIFKHPKNAGHYWQGEEVEKIENKIAGLMKEYHRAVVKYNKYAPKLPDGKRKTLLNNLLEDARNNLRVN